MRRLPMLLVVAACLAGCGTAEPFYDKASEFNRSQPYFAKEPPDISEVGICYAKSSTTAETVSGMAVARCAAFGKRAVFRSQDVLNCPMRTPVRAMYDCVAP